MAASASRPRRSIARGHDVLGCPSMENRIDHQVLIPQAERTQAQRWCVPLQPTPSALDASRGRASWPPHPRGLAPCPGIAVVATVTRPAAPSRKSRWCSGRGNRSMPWAATAAARCGRWGPYRRGRDRIPPSSAGRRAAARIRRRPRSPPCTSRRVALPCWRPPPPAVTSRYGPTTRSRYSRAASSGSKFSANRPRHIRNRRRFVRQRNAQHFIQIGRRIRAHQEHAFPAVRQRHRRSAGQRGLADAPLAREEQVARGVRKETHAGLLPREMIECTTNCGLGLSGSRGRSGATARLVRPPDADPPTFSISLPRRSPSPCAR